MWFANSVARGEDSTTKEAKGGRKGKTQLLVSLDISMSISDKQEIDRQISRG